MSAVLLVQADARKIPLADHSVHMVCTSPPYWGLRDYGTGIWAGGDPACAHPVRTAGTRDKDLASSSLGGGKKTIGHYQEGFRHECPRCGAVRQDQQLGLEGSHDCNGAFTGIPCGECYICHMRAVFQDVWRVLRGDGTCWVNIGDSYANDGKWGGATGGKHVAALHGEPIGRRKRRTGLKPKDLCMIPARLALALQGDGWYLRSEIVWHKPSAMPESVHDRPTRAHETVWLLAKQARYFYDQVAVNEEATMQPQRRTHGHSAVAGLKYTTFGHIGDKGVRATLSVDGDGTRHSRDVWSIPAAPYAGAHYAVFPPALVARCIKAGTSEYGVCNAPIRKLRLKRDLTPEAREKIARFFAKKGLAYEHGTS